MLTRGSCIVFTGPKGLRNLRSVHVPLLRWCGPILAEDAPTITPQCWSKLEFGAGSLHKSDRTVWSEGGGKSQNGLCDAPPDHPLRHVVGPSWGPPESAPSRNATYATSSVFSPDSVPDMAVSFAEKRSWRGFWRRGQVCKVQQNRGGRGFNRIDKTGHVFS